MEVTQKSTNIQATLAIISETKQTLEFSFILLISSSRKKHAKGRENRHQEINVEDNKDTKTTPIHPKEGENKERKRKE